MKDSQYTLLWKKQHHTITGPNVPQAVLRFTELNKVTSKFQINAPKDIGGQRTWMLTNFGDSADNAQNIAFVFKANA